jgi:16S rRNA (guanine527-N7)-methyltransferase
MTNSKYFPEHEVRRALAPFGVAVTAELAGGIATYAELLLKWNAKVNLTAITGPGELLARHFGESLFAAQFIADEEALLIDVGSGAGFPGLALKLTRPRLRVLLLEPVRKKAAFLAEVARTLRLSNVQVEAKRTTDVAPEKLQALFITARALGHLDELLKWSAAALQEGGQVLLWLGRDDAGSVAASQGWRWIEPSSIPSARASVILRGFRR